MADKYVNVDKLLLNLPNESYKGVLKRILIQAPAADVVEVRHGRWIPATGSWLTPGGDPVWECSECGKGKHVYGVEHDTYGSDIADGQWVVCPNCGAKMEGDGE